VSLRRSAFVLRAEFPVRLARARPLALLARGLVGLAEVFDELLRRLSLHHRRRFWIRHGLILPCREPLFNGTSRSVPQDIPLSSWGARRFRPGPSAHQPSRRCGSKARSGSSGPRTARQYCRPRGSHPRTNPSFPSDHGLGSSQESAASSPRPELPSGSICGSRAFKFTDLGPGEGAPCWRAGCRGHQSSPPASRGARLGAYGPLIA
jgi:hypothetical protein